MPETNSPHGGRTLRKLNPELFKFEAEGSFVEGVLVGSRIHDFKTGPATKYTLRKEDGNLVVFFGAAMLDSLMDTVEVGTYVHIVFKGQEKTTEGQPLNMYDVSVAE